MLEVVAVAVEKDVPEPSSDDDPDNDAEHNGDKRVGINVHLPPAGKAHDEKRGADESEHIGDAVPANSKRPDRKGDRVEMLIDVVKQEGYSLPIPAPTSIAANRTSSRKARGIVCTDDTRAPHFGHLSVNRAISLLRTIIDS